MAEYHGKTTFPKGFVLRRSYLNSTVLRSDDLPVTLELENPVPGTWFLAAFVEKKDDQVIKKVERSLGIVTVVAVIVIGIITGIIV